ncbi:hypothetical protein PTKIN_Ptkin01aG0134300 [Pterospermum kingtungense]
MAKELAGIWHLLTITDEERDTVEVGGVWDSVDRPEEKSWLMAKLLTNRPFNKDAMLNTFRVVWSLARDFKVLVLETNLFLFNSASIYDKNRVLD